MKRVDLDFRTQDLVRTHILPASLFEHNASLTISQFILLPRRSVLLLGRLERLPGHFDPERFIGQLPRLRREYGLRSLALVGAHPERREYILLLRTHLPPLLARWIEQTEIDLVPSSASRADADKTRVSFLVPPSGPKPLSAFLRDLGIPFVLRTRSARPFRDELTARQRELLLRALESGYYDLPARITLGRLAALARISKATLSRHLRKALKRILVSYFAERES